MSSEPQTVEALEKRMVAPTKKKGGAPADEDEDYEVENVLEERKGRGGKAEFRVKWKDHAEETWEPLANCKGGENLIESFHRYGAAGKPHDADVSALKAQVQAKQETFDRRQVELNRRQAELTKQTAALHAERVEQTAPLRGRRPYPGAGTAGSCMATSSSCREMSLTARRTKKRRRRSRRRSATWP